MGSCLSCYKRESREREPLLPKTAPPLSSPRSPLDKAVDVLAGLQSGKLPSQDQLDAILRSAICSGFLKNDPRNISNPLSGNGQRVVRDVREVLESLLQFAMEKNMDDRLQDMVYRITQIEGPLIHADADTPIEAGQERLSQFQVEAPTRVEMMHDATTLMKSLKAVTRLLITSATFRLLLSDIFSSMHAALARIASEVGIVAQQVQVAAEGIERAANMEGGSVTILPGKLEEGVEGVWESVEEATARSQLYNEERTKDTFVTRMQDFIVRAHQEPRSLDALRMLLELTRKYASQLSQSAVILLKTTTASSKVSITPTTETSLVLQDLRVLLERLASGHSLDPLLHSFLDTINSLTENMQDDSSSNVQRDADLHRYLSTVDRWLSRALDAEQPLYATSRNGTRALENIYDGGNIIFLSSSASYPPSSWIQPLRDFLDAYDSYSTALLNDRSITRLLLAFSTLHGDLKNLTAVSSGLGTHMKRAKEELKRDLLGWILPRVINALGRIGVPMPRAEYKSGRFAGALDTLKMGPGQTGGVMLDAVPDQVVVRTSNEVRIDMRQEIADTIETSGALTSCNSRVQVHVDGVRVAVRDLGYFVSYGSGMVGYSDQGLLSLEIGSSEAARIDSVSQGLSLDIDLSFDPSPSNSESAPAAPTSLFDVLDVHVALPGVRLKLDKSKHWILNKIFVQPFAGPLVSRVAANILEANIRAGLEKLSSGMAIVMEAGRQSQNDSTTNAEVGFLDYWEALLETGPRAFGLIPSVEQEQGPVDTCSRTTTNLKGLVHTTTTVASSSSSLEPQETEASVAVGRGPILFPDKAGAYGEDDGSGALGRVAREVGHAVDHAGTVVDSTVESAAEIRGEMERAEERRGERKKVESLREGWRSHVFDIR